MKLILLFFGLSISLLRFNSNSGHQDIEQLPIVEVRQWVFTELESCLIELKSTKNLIASKKTQSEIVRKKNEARRHFKKIEWVLSHFDIEQFNLEINGAPLPKLMKKVPEISIIDPKGFQRLEELLAEEELNYDSSLTITNGLIKSLESLLTKSMQSQISDAFIFEGMRYGVVRINTMGLSGFDLPVSAENGLLESSYTIDGILKVGRLYSNYLTKEEWIEFERLCTNSISKLRTTKFDDLNRVEFIKTNLDALWRILLEFQNKMNIELPKHYKRNLGAVNYESKSMFSNDFLRMEYFAEYQDETKSDLQFELGKLLFFDPILSLNNQRACASCHDPKKAFADGKITPLNLDKQSSGLRNSPTLINAVFADRYFHDMRADKLSSQMDHVVLDPTEFASNYFEIVKKLKLSEDYVELFDEVYGAEGISRNTVTNAVTSYIARLNSFNSDFDKFIRDESESISNSVVNGYNLFAGKAGCATCHFAPTFAGLVPPLYNESESEVLGVPAKNTKPYVLDDDPGRFMNGLLKERVSFYNGSIKTPSLRNVALTAPYMHNGQFETLEDVMEFYNNGGGTGINLDVPNQTLPADSLSLSDAEIEDIINFMKALTDTSDLTFVPSSLPSFSKEELNLRKIGGNY
ncbi:MAG: hypothetical protein MK105_03240 [Crocinitomicaceae bacterium]|nr:hypothetical protein [Crocinitomicaceae bacterium]